jgi:hypothetical protein
VTIAAVHDSPQPQRYDQILNTDASRLGVSYALYAHRREELSDRASLSAMRVCGRQTAASDFLGPLPPMSSLRPRLGPAAATPILGGELRSSYWRTRVRPVIDVAAPFGSHTRRFRISQSGRVSWNCGTSRCGDVPCAATWLLTCLMCGPWMFWCAACASRARMTFLDWSMRMDDGGSWLGLRAATAVDQEDSQ